MASRLDELHGHQYTTQRVVNALVRLDPDPGRKPSRAILPVLVGLVITALLMVAVPIWGALTGHNAPDDLRETSTVLVEKESGAQFVYTKADDQLHPVLNYTSGLLVSDGDGGDPVMVYRSRLAELRKDAGVTIGATLGIPGAPNALPRPADLTRDAWQVCSRGAQTDLFVGADSVHDGHVLASPTATNPGEALLVQGPDQRVYLIFGNRQLLIPDPTVAQTAFGWIVAQAQPVSGGFLKTLPYGPDLVAPKFAGTGSPSRVVQAKIGRLYEVPGTNTNQWAVALRDRVLPITDVQAQLILASPHDGEPIKVSTADFAKLPGIGAPISEPELAGTPALIPTLVKMTAVACARVPDAATGVSSIQVDPKTATAAPAAKTDQARSDPAKTPADRISVPFGRGVLVRNVASPTAPANSGTLAIITDSGIQYSIADQAAQAKLGYGNTTPLAMPSSLVDLFPAGPALSTGAAAQPPS